VTKLVQAALTGIDPAIAIAQPQAMNVVVTQALGQARLMMTLLGIFAGVALLLATVGIYGAVAYTVEQAPAKSGCAWRSAHKPWTCCAWLCPKE